MPNWKRTVSHETACRTLGKGSWAGPAVTGTRSGQKMPAPRRLTDPDRYNRRYHLDVGGVKGPNRTSSTGSWPQGLIGTEFRCEGLIEKSFQTINGDRLGHGVSVRGPERGSSSPPE